MGTPKAAVLPVPVCACPMTSLPSSKGIIALALIVKWFPNPSSYIPFKTSPLSGKYLNDCISNVSFLLPQNFSCVFLKLLEASLVS
jgi:hypothetical protein